MIRVYCDNSGYRDELKVLEKGGHILLIMFPTEFAQGNLSGIVRDDIPGRLEGAPEPPGKSREVLEASEKITLQDAIHLDTAVKGGCSHFLTRDKVHILKNKDYLEKLFDIKILHADEDWEAFERAADPLKQIKKMWIASGILLALTGILVYNGIARRHISGIIGRVETGNFGMLWNSFEGDARKLLYVTKLSLLSLDYEILRSGFDWGDNNSIILWARYRHEPGKDFPPFVKIRIIQKPEGGLLLMYWGDKEYLSLRNPVVLPRPFYEELYGYVRSGKYPLKETMQDGRTPYYRPPEKVRGIKP